MEIIDFEQAGARKSIFGRLVKVFPATVAQDLRQMRRPRTWIDGEEYTLDDDGEWVAVED